MTGRGFWSSFFFFFFWLDRIAVFCENNSTPYCVDVKMGSWSVFVNVLALSWNVVFSSQVPVALTMSFPPPLNRQPLSIPQLPPGIPPPQFGTFGPPVPPGIRFGACRKHLRNHRHCANCRCSEWAFPSFYWGEAPTLDKRTLNKNDTKACILT